jgi:hypothetical protein
MKTEIVDVIAKAHFFDERIGAVGRKQRLRIPKSVAEYLVNLEMVDYVNPPMVAPQEVQSIEPVENGVEQPSAVSQPAQVLPEQTATPSRRGKRKKAGESLE